MLESFGLRPDARAKVTTAIRAQLQLFQGGKPDDALRSYDEALRNRDGDPATWTAKAVLLKKLGRQIDAVAAYDRAIALPEAPADSDVKTRASAPSALAPHVTPDSWPVPFALKFAQICGTRAARTSSDAPS